MNTEQQRPQPQPLPSMEEVLSQNLTTEQLCSLVRELVARTSTRFKNDLIGENDELLERNLRQYGACVARNSWKAAQKWSKWNDEGPVLMPDYTRVYYRKGGTEVVLQEFPPQTRLMKFKGRLAARDNSSAAINAELGDKTFSYSLALPYTVFVFKFRDGLFTNVYCAFSDRPLRKLEEQPLVPYLSNLDSNLKVCLGTSFDSEKLVEGNINQQCSFVLDHFWHSTYSDEWSGHFWDSKRHFSGDQRMATLSGWEDASAENPLFVVEDVDWLVHKDENFGDMIVRLFDDDRENTAFQQEIFNTLTDEFLDEVKGTLQQNLERVEEKMSDSDDLITKNLVEIIAEQGA